jgi:hypothetical protein
MTEQKPRASSDQLLDLLLDALAERQAARRKASMAASAAAPTSPVAPASAAAKAPAEVSSKTSPSKQREPRPGDDNWQPPPLQPSIRLDRTIWKLFLLLGALIIIVNIPLNRFGVSLARLLPPSSSLIIRDGLVLKGDGPEIYVLENNKLRWVSSLQAFEHKRLKWDQVHIVEDSFLAQFEKGQPIHVLVKCASSPHIYRLEGEQKRWIKDIATFTAEGHVWEDVRIVPCEYLRGLPDGATIPEGAGPPPKP